MTTGESVKLAIDIVLLSICAWGFLTIAGYALAAGICRGINDHLRLKIQNNSNVYHKVAE